MGPIPPTGYTLTVKCPQCGRTMDAGNWARPDVQYMSCASIGPGNCSYNDALIVTAVPSYAADFWPDAIMPRPKG